MSVAFRHLTRAVAVALVLGLLPDASLIAQRAGTGRVTITSKPSGAALRPPSRAVGRPPMVMAKTLFDVQNWFSRAAAPAALPASRDAIVIARELKLENINYTVDAPQLVLVADRLRIGANGVIDASGRQMRVPGRKIVLIARHITCESGGTLNLISKGGTFGAAGGNVVVVAGSVEGATLGDPGAPKRWFNAERVRDRRPIARGSRAEPRGTPPPATSGVLPSCITAAVDGGPGATVQVRDHRNKDAEGRPATRTDTIPPGRPGQVTGSPLHAAVQGDAFVQTAWSMWAVEWLETLQLEIYDASRMSDYQRVLKLLRDYAAFNEPPELVAGDMRERYLAVLGDLNSYRNTALPALSVEELTVRPGNLPQNVTVFTEGATLRATLAPTHALASRATFDGRSVLGTLEYRNERPDELAIEVEWELTVDPWSERLAAEQLTKTGQRLDGVFSGWSLEAKPMQELGVRSATATLFAGSRRLRVRFVVDAERANLVFWRLLNSAGLPWTVDWTFREPKTGRVVTGTWAGPPLTLVRQRDPSVTVTDGLVANSGSSPVTINYVRTKDGSFVALEPALRIKAGESVQLPASIGGDGPVVIPPEAIETAFDPERFSSNFYVVNGEQVVDRVTIKNNLPTSDPLRGVFDRLVITVTATVDGDTAMAPVVAGPFDLSAAGTKGAEISIPFLKLTRGARRTSIEGTAHYLQPGETTGSGSQRTLKPTVFDTLTVSITPDMFRE